MTDPLDRRQFLALLGASAGALGSAPGWLRAAALGITGGGLSAGCGSDPEDPDRYTLEDIERLAAQRAHEAATAGRGRFGAQRYAGYRGLADLPWFDLDAAGTLHCSDDSIPRAIDFHCHFGISVLAAPTIDLHARPGRVRHLLDCDASDPGCDLDLDVYINGNFTQAALRTLQWNTIAQGLWGSPFAETQTLPNLLDEMDAMRVERAAILPIVFGFPFGDDLPERWMQAIETSGTGNRFIKGASIHPRDPDWITHLEAQARAGARVLKLHPTMQRFYPDAPEMMEIYAAAEGLGLIVFFHGGRAGIEPESSHRYAMPRHYEGALASFPELPFVLGHSGARDAAAMLEIGARHENAWFGTHGQSVTHLDEMIRRTGGERMLFGTDWPFYHLAASLAKILIVTNDEERADLRVEILRSNALRLLGEDTA